MKKAILQELYQQKGTYLSGEELAERFGVSRTAIWKHINNLKKEGYSIETVNKKGYRLLENDNKLVPQELLSMMNTKEIGKNILYFDSIDSTNNYAKQIANHSPHGTLIISDEQLAGRGRLGRGWSSPKGEGIWMSILLKPQIPPTEGAKMTQIAAAAVCLAIKEMTGLATLIKWPNDIVLGGKKVCGILTEMAGELNEVSYLIVGIGINVNIKEFPEDLQEKATSLLLAKGTPIERKVLIAKTMDQFELLYQHYLENHNLSRTVEVCRSFSAVLGKNIQIIRGGESTTALAIDITEDGLLKVKQENGQEETLLSGEISIRGNGVYI